MNLIERLRAGCPTYVENMSNNRPGTISGDVDAATEIMDEAATALETMRDALEQLARLPPQVRNDLKAAHAVICKLQGNDPEQMTWPDWSPPGITLAWCDHLDKIAAEALAKVRAS